MKNDEQMFQSVLSRRDEYRERKNKRIQIIKRTVPVLACFCLAVGLGLGYRESAIRLTKDSPSDVVEEYSVTTTDSTSPLEVTPVTTEPSTVEVDVTIQATDSTDVTVTQTAPVTSSQQPHSVTTKTAVSNDDTVKGHELPVTTAPVIQTQPITELQTTPPGQIPTETQTSVDNNHETPIATETTEPILPVGPPAQPVRFTEISDAIGSVNSGDVSHYPEHDQDSYRYMFERLKSDGFLYQVNNSDTVSLIEDRGITLFPYASYEDVGVGCYVKYKEISFHVTFYYANRSLTAQTNGIAEYMKSRMGRRCDKEITIHGQTVSVMFSNNGQIYASAFIDNDHYFDVVTSASEEALMSFLNAFRYEQIPL